MDEIELCITRVKKNFLTLLSLCKIAKDDIV